MTIALTIMVAAFLVTAAPALAQLAPKDENVRRPTVCTEQYLPVCGRLNNVGKTYPNQCYAHAAGAEVIARGPCGEGRVPPGPR